MSTRDAKNGAQVLRTLALLEVLCGSVITGLTNKDLAAALNVPPPYVTRTCALLIQKGWVEKDEASGRFRVTPRFSRLVFRVLDDFERAKQQLGDLQHNYTLGR